MELPGRALYNLLRMNWLSDSAEGTEPWQVQDYRALPLLSIFQQLSKFGLRLDKDAFLNMAEPYDTPEELTDALLAGIDISPEGQDKIYLLIFELWRRLLPEKISLSILCDELDNQIFLYDQCDPTVLESIQDTIANLLKLIDDSSDRGEKPADVFASICSGCANDLKSFLYDYIAEQIDVGHHSYAAELLDGFGRYIKNDKWFDLLAVRLAEFTDGDAYRAGLKKLTQRACREDDAQFNLELLSSIIHAGDIGDFSRLAKKTALDIKSEEDFRDLLAICGDFYRYVDEEERELAIQKILDQRDSNGSDRKISSEDPHIQQLINIIR